MGPYRYLALAAAARLAAARLMAGLPTETIDLDLPPAERWRSFAAKYRDGIINRAGGMGVIYEDGLGEYAARWAKAAPLDAELMAEFKSIVETVNHPEVTLQRLILTDMWHAVHAPTFECTGLLAAMPNGTVIHGRNIDYDVQEVAKRMLKSKAKANVASGNGGFFEGVFLKGGKPIVHFLGSPGSLGTHTGMRLGGWSYNSNARLVENNMTLNLKATESGSRNFPWMARKFLTEIPDYASALRAFEGANFNAPNYFILAGAGPYEGAIVTADRGGVRQPGTPPVQSLSRERGVWHLVQTNDDQLEPPLDARRGAALTRLARSPQSQVSMDFVERQMLAEPTTNSDTLLTWIANPGAGTHKTIPRSMVHVMEGLASKLWHKAMHLPMPQDLPPTKRPPGAKAQGSSFLHLG